MNARTVAIGLGVVLSVASLNAQTNHLETQKVAARALTTFGKLAGDQNFKAMGFESKDDAKQATLGEPFDVFMVRLDNLRDFQGGANPNKLLTSLDRVVYPVLVSGQVRSLITVEKVKEKWEATSFGGANMSKMLSKTRATVAEATRLPPSAYFQVQIPALNAYFVAHRVDGKLMLTAIYDDAALNLKAGKTLPAEEVFATLAPIAKRYNGLPL